jgi:hypothetical protein
MGTTLKRIAGVLAVAIAGAVVPFAPASADPGDTLKGGCGYQGAGGSLITPGTNQGVIYDLSVSQEGNGGPSFATVECWINVNGIKQNSTDLTASGTGVQAGQRVASFNAFDTDAVALCTKVTFALGDGTPGWTDCPALTEFQIPPQAIIDLLTSVQFEFVNPIVCPVLASLAPLNVANVLLVQPGGDVYLSRPLGGGYYWVYDCPPYGDGTGGTVTSSSLTGFSGGPLL